MPIGMRAFVAIEVPAEVKGAIAALQAAARRAGAGVSWTRPENIHLTLRFLGEIGPELLGQVEGACREAAGGGAPFELTLSGAGFFPHARAPRVIWVGLAGEVEPARRLQQRLDESLAARGFSRDPRPFRPHLTVGRIKSARPPRGLTALAASYPLPALSFVAREIKLMRSELLPEGARYTALAGVSLGR